MWDPTVAAESASDRANGNPGTSQRRLIRISPQDQGSPHRDSFRTLWAFQLAAYVLIQSRNRPRLIDVPLRRLRIPPATRQIAEIEQRRRLVLLPGTDLSRQP